MIPFNLPFGIGAGICGTLCVGYLLYIEYKKYEKEKIKNQLLDMARNIKSRIRCKRTCIRIQYPMLFGFETIKRCLLEEMDLVNNSISNGEFGDHIDCIAHSIIICEQRDEMINILKDVFPANTFNTIMERVEAYNENEMINENLDDTLDDNLNNTI